MSKTFAKYFPLFDHLYILQVFEYNFWNFLKWFFIHPFERNLQKKHKLIFTKKLTLLALLSLGWLFVLSLVTFRILFRGFWAFTIPFAWLLLFQLTPLPILLSVITLKPLDIFIKRRILRQTEKKLRKLNNLKIVAITGSFGKTSTKDILYTLLWKKFYVVKTPKSFNTPLGISQTILEDVKDNTQILIAEVGAYRRGEIKKIARLLKPQIGIITAIAPQHLERFKTLENIAKAKFELVENLSQNSIAILNGIGPYLQNLASRMSSGNVVFYGGQSDKFKVADVRTSIDGTSFTLVTPKGRTNITIPLIGAHHALNFLAASAAALELGMSLKEIKKRAKWLLPTPHRMEISQTINYTLIDNSYNTNPQSAKLSFRLLEQLTGSKKILITPGLAELGKESEKENKAFAKNAAQVADEIIIVGQHAKKYLLEGLRRSYFPKEHIHLVVNTQEGLILANSISGKDAVILIENDLPDQYF